MKNEAPVCTWPSCKCTALDQCIGLGIRTLSPAPDVRVKRLLSLAGAASSALRSYQYGNTSTELAEGVANELDAALRDMGGG